MPPFRVYLERADGNEPKRPLPDVIWGYTAGIALQKAAEWYEIPSHDLVLEQITLQAWLPYPPLEPKGDITP